MKPGIVFETKKIFCSAFACLGLISIIFTLPFRAQTNGNLTPLVSENSQITTLDNGKGNSNEKKNLLANDFRVEKTPVEGTGAEIITIFINLRGASNIEPKNNSEIRETPLFSVLRDTLGDNRIENDRLRYVWMLTYVKPSFAQRFASFVPFLYARTTNKKNVGNNAPSPIMDLSPTGKDMWNGVFWMVFKNLVLNDLGIPVKSSVLQNQTNETNHRQTAIARALAILSLYESIEGEKILSHHELKDIQARMWLSDKTFGSMMQPENLHRVYNKNVEQIRDARGHNWELLRQYTEAQKLYFEPLEMPDGSATHALVWVAEQDLASAGKDQKFESRFLNIKNPWKDKRLINWKGYSEVRWYDKENRRVKPNSPNAEPKTMIPLALYGLDYPKIPTLLVDFRDRDNPKKREMSRRILQDLTSNVLSISKFGNLPYFVGRYLYDFATSRRGMDLNQASRFRSYSQLKLLLSLDASLDKEFRADIANRLETVSLNPLENDLDVEINVARKQYENLIAYAKRPGGLAAKIEKDRREEMSRLKHGGGQRALFALGHLLSLGIYTHREQATPELRARLSLRRELDYHERFLREVARTSAKPEIDSDIEAVKRSLAFVSRNTDTAAFIKTKTISAVARLFSITDDQNTRLLCLNALRQINNPAARKEMQAFYENKKLDAYWRNQVAAHLNLPPVKEAEDTQISSSKGENGKSGGH